MNITKFIITMLTLLFFNNAFAYCNINSSNLNFGNYSSPGQKTDLFSSSRMNINCFFMEGNETISVKLSLGNSTPNINRFLINQKTKDKIYYNIYTNNNYSSIFSNGVNNTKYVNQKIKNNLFIPIFAAAYKNQNISPGVYTDNIYYIVEF